MGVGGPGSRVSTGFVCKIISHHVCIYDCSLLAMFHDSIFENNVSQGEQHNHVLCLGREMSWIAKLSASADIICLVHNTV